MFYFFFLSGADFSLKVLYLHNTRAEGSENESGLCAFGTEEREFQRPQRLRRVERPSREMEVFVESSESPRKKEKFLRK